MTASAAGRRVTLVDVRPRADTFIGDSALERTERRLAEAGHAVAIVRAVRPIDAEQGAWAESVAEEVRAARGDVVVVARAWSASFVDALRQAAAGAPLLRLSGIAAALDEKFDAVVDAEALLAWISGAPLPAPRKSPLRPRDLRALGALDADTRAEAGGRPTITGPAIGCPFLLDARQNPRFARLALDEQVQTRGCTFCLDNVGTYAMPREDEALAAWLGQLRSLRAARPEAREVLLVDERPHPFLPALFAALAAEPALHGLTVLVKSRVDWLLEFAREIERAIELAATSGSVLDLYLVGFESFDQAQLDLFNKGVTVADNVRAIELMRALGQRHPRAFAFDRHRAHGIVLFTPWSTPASLLENARRMREVRFDELRTEALRTRLRLYPRTPLHALAAHEGLLAGAFDEGRPDRAAEQGYDASVPWRFADARVEAIFQAANALRARHRELREADALELATRLLLERGVLAEAPSIAFAPLGAAVLAHGAREAIDVERVLADALFASIDRGRRPTEGRTIAKQDAPALVEAARRMGLAAAARDEGSNARVVLARDASALERALLAEAPPLPARIAQGARAHGHHLAALGSDSFAHRFALEREGARLGVTIVSSAVAGPCAIRRGAFGVEIEAGGPLRDDDRVAIGAVVRALPV